ncbi:helix-turn-helix transcriptional regulator [Streptomyces sp. t39]|uniref:helix-turn-helix transcriptional regulator n=1 Tax=Streptomyces sp. t39 TaxID=1828156 RepID=UPI0021C8190B|nr:AraC family transcriptional regulator [Streptomyces sp. t39]
MEYAVQCAVKTIRERYFEPLTLDELAHAAMVSKFHFLRSFRRITGVTPGRFLSAIRLHEAKILLLTTSLNVSDIGAQVGYSSTGSFTRRFSESVGCSPTQYRHSGHGQNPPVDPGAALAGEGLAEQREMDLLPEAAPRREQEQGCVTGVVKSPGRTASGIYIGVFESPILERTPAARAVVAHSGQFRIGGVPEGTWYVHAVAQGAHAGAAGESTAHQLLVGTAGPVQVGPGTDPIVQMTLHPLGWSNPPILFAFPGEGAA